MSKTITRELFQTAYANSESELQERIAEEKTRKTGRKKLYITTYGPSESEELVFLSGSDFKQIFGEPDKNRSREKQTIVKIYNPESKRSIYRLFRTCHDIKIKGGGYAAVTYTAIRKLTNSADGIDNLKTVQLSEGCMVPFYWNHPNPATRVTVKFGVYGLIVSIFSFLITLFC